MLTYIEIEGIKKKITTRKDGYQIISINRKLKYLHRFLAEKYIPNPENKPCVNHIDGNPSNNSLDNLEWVTYYENNEHAKENNLWGSNIKKRMKLTKFDIQQAKELRESKITYKEIAEKFKVDYKTIYNAINNLSYNKNYLICS